MNQIDICSEQPEHLWKGMPIRDMTREQLIEVIIEISEMLRQMECSLKALSCEPD